MVTCLLQQNFSLLSEYTWLMQLCADLDLVQDIITVGYDDYIFFCQRTFASRFDCRRFNNLSSWGQFLAAAATGSARQPELINKNKQAVPANEQVHVPMKDGGGVASTADWSRPRVAEDRLRQALRKSDHNLQFLCCSTFFVKGKLFYFFWECSSDRCQLEENI